MFQLFGVQPHRSKTFKLSTDPLFVDVDIDAGRVISENQTLEEMGWEMFNRILAIASGQQTCAERLGLHNQLALFNPGPVT